MSALKEFCNTQDVDQREKLLLKYEKSKCVPLVEWAQFVIKEFGWNPPMPEVEVKKK